MSNHSGSEPGQTESDSGAVDRDELRRVLSDHPVSVAVLFGSQADGTADAQSDIDIVVEFESVEDRGQAFLSLLSDLSIALDRNDIDLSLVSDLDPRVGRIAFRDGERLVGTPDRVAELRSEFEARVDTDTSSDALRERFDAALASIDEIVDGEA